MLEKHSFVMFNMSIYTQGKIQGYAKMNLKDKNYSQVTLKKILKDLN